MPNPKRRHSKRRTSTRRAHDHLRLPGICGVPELPRTQIASSRLPEVRPIQGP